MIGMDGLEARVRRLEDREAIRSLKARYFFACDSKHVQGVRDCFPAGKVMIDYGRIGVFDDREQLVEVFERLACHEHIVEMHHGENMQIELIDAAQARGTCGLFYHLINTRDGVATQLGAYYQDEYRKLDGEWKIVSTRCVVISTLVMDFADGLAKVLFAGRTAPADIDDPTDQA